MKSLCFVVSTLISISLSATSMATERVILEKQVNLMSTTKLDNLLQANGISADYSLKTLNNFSTHFAKNYIRMQQTYKGLKIWGEHIVSTRSLLGNVENLQGSLYKGLDVDLPSLLPKLSAKKALNLIKNRFSTNSMFQHKYNNEKAELQIYINSAQKAYLVWVIDFIVDSLNGGKPSRPMALVDAMSGEIIDQWDGLTFAEATGPGGNIKTGKYNYGTQYNYLDVTKSDNICTMENSKSKTINLNNKTYGGKVHSFTCPENTVKEINGAYSPLNDAHYFGSVIYDMYKNWYSLTPLSTKLELRVHYSNSYENAFWDGTAMTFGDGSSSFYPLVSLDVTSHEIAHGFTEHNSGLIYRAQSGGINESFSDMAGEAAEYYMKNANDFQIGADIFKQAGEALRYMDAPTKDGHSIDHVKNYNDNIDVHYSAGIYNKAFYLLATTSGWNTRKAFDAFLYANKGYWKPSTTFNSGVCGVQKAAKDLGYNVEDVTIAFNGVGAVCDETNNNKAPVASYNYKVDINNPLKVELNDTSTDSDGTIKSWLWTLPDGTTYATKNVTHTFTNYGTYKVKLTVTDDDGASTSVEKSIDIQNMNGEELINNVEIKNLSANVSTQKSYYIKVPAGAKSLNFVMKGTNGDADLYIKYGVTATTSSWDYRPYASGSNEKVTIAKVKEGIYYVMIRAYKAYSGLSLLATYE